MMVKRPSQVLLENVHPEVKAYLEELERVYNKHKQKLGRQKQDRRERDDVIKAELQSIFEAQERIIKALAFK